MEKLEWKDIFCEKYKVHAPLLTDDELNNIAENYYHPWKMENDPIQAAADAWDCLDGVL